jgi:hypothetical protein
MQCLDLTSYQQARALCAGKRFEKKGRKLDNYTRIRLISAAGADTERLEILNWQNRAIATLYPHNLVAIPAIEKFTTHQMWLFFHLYTDRNKKKYKYVSGVVGRKYLVDAPVYGRFEQGKLLLVDGKPIPTIEKDSDASLVWRRQKQQMDKAFTTCCKLEAFGEYALRVNRMSMTQRDLGHSDRCAEFVRLVRECDVHGMAAFMAAIGLATWVDYKHDVLHQAFRDSYKNYYVRNRRDILIAAGARVET